MERVSRRCPKCVASTAPPKARDCPGCRKTRADAWYQANKGKYAAWRDQWRKKNPEAYRALKRREADKARRTPERAAYDRAWKKAHREQSYAQKARWIAKNREHYLETRKTSYLRKTYGEFAEARMLTKLLLKEIKTYEGDQADNDRREPKAAIVGNAPRRASKKGSPRHR